MTCHLFPQLPQPHFLFCQNHVVLYPGLHPAPSLLSSFLTRPSSGPWLQNPSWIRPVTKLSFSLLLQSMGFASHLSLNLSLICFMFLDTLERNFHWPEVSWELPVCKKLPGHFCFEVLIMRREEGPTNSQGRLSRSVDFLLPLCSLLLPLSSPPLCPFLLCPEWTRNRFHKGIQRDQSQSN